MKINTVFSNGERYVSYSLKEMIYGIRFYFRVSKAFWAHISIAGKPCYFCWKTPDDIEIIRIE